MGQSSVMACLVCGIGTYSNMTGQSACRSCLPGYVYYWIGTSVPVLSNRVVGGCQIHDCAAIGYFSLNMSVAVQILCATDGPLRVCALSTRCSLQSNGSFFRSAVPAGLLAVCVRVLDVQHLSDRIVLPCWFVVAHPLSARDVWQRDRLVPSELHGTVHAGLSVPGRVQLVQAAAVPRV